MTTKDEFVRKMHSELDQWNNEIDALITKADKATKTHKILIVKLTLFIRPLPSCFDASTCLRRLLFLGYLQRGAP